MQQVAQSAYNEFRVFHSHIMCTLNSRILIYWYGLWATNQSGDRIGVARMKNWG